jgi:uncharacterized protein (TIGR02466 family)
MTAVTESLFVTPLYRAELPPKVARPLNAELDRTCRVIAADDEAGQRWCADKAYRGYTSYASLNDLAWRASIFEELQAHLDAHAAAFAKAVGFDMGREAPRLDSLWINILEPGGMHSGHIHPHSIISGTYYVTVPKGSSALRFEDPRLPLMMAAPVRKARAPRELQPFVSVTPKAGTLLLWESWLRHEVLVNQAAEARISISFNYA